MGWRKRLDAALETVVFRFAQEALTNICRHAHAGHAWISVECSGFTLRLDVADDGDGFGVQTRMGQALNSGHLGLASMYGRTEAARIAAPQPIPPAQGPFLNVSWVYPE